VKFRNTVAALAIAAAVLFLPAPAIAQARAVPRVAPPATRAAVAVPRPAPYYRPTGYYRPYGYYPPYGYYRPYGYYAPYGYYSPYYFGFSVGFGYPCCGYPYYGYWGYPGPYGYTGSSLHVQVTPREAEVFVDGYYAGKVDDFDGTFQRLRLEPGQHSVQLYLAGHRTVQQELYLQPGSTFDIKTTLAPLGPGEPEPARPVAPPAPQRGEFDGAVTVTPRPLPRNTDTGLGTLAIRVRPADATVTIDGEQWGSSPDADRVTVVLPPGVHRLEINKEGYRPYSADVSVRAGETEAVNVALTK
jgi:PEGA domain-containing protein